MCAHVSYACPGRGAHKTGKSTTLMATKEFASKKRRAASCSVDGSNTGGWAVASRPHPCSWSPRGMLVGTGAPAALLLGATCVAKVSSRPRAASVNGGVSEDGGIAARAGFSFQAVQPEMGLDNNRRFRSWFRLLYLGRRPKGHWHLRTAVWETLYCSIFSYITCIYDNILNTFVVVYNRGWVGLDLTILIANSIDLSMALL